MNSPPPTGVATTIPRRAAYSIEEARGLLGGISRASIYELINDGSLATVKIAGRRLVPEGSITRLIDIKLRESA